MGCREPKRLGPELGAPVAVPPAHLERWRYGAAGRVRLDNGANVSKEVIVDRGAVAERDGDADLARAGKIGKPGDGFDDKGRPFDVAVALRVATAEQHRYVSSNLVGDRRPLLGEDQNFRGTREILDRQPRDLRPRPFADLSLDRGNDDAEGDRLARPRAKLRHCVRREQLALELIRF